MSHGAPGEFEGEFVHVGLQREKVSEEDRRLGAHVSPERVRVCKVGIEQRISAHEATPESACGLRVSSMVHSYATGPEPDGSGLGVQMTSQPSMVRS